MGRPRPLYTVTPRLQSSPEPTDLYDLFGGISPSLYCWTIHDSSSPWLGGDTSSPKSNGIPIIRVPGGCMSKEDIDRIVREMKTGALLRLLCEHGCKDVSEQLVLPKYPDFPFASGGFGDVFRASLRNGISIAIKCIPAKIKRGDEYNTTKRLALELARWSKCSHPNILPLIGVAEYRDQFAMVSEWMGHGSLSKYLITYPDVNRLSICGRVAEGVAYIHSEGIVHGDLRAANVLISTDGIPKLTDFGSAIMRESFQFTRSREGINFSLRFMAPEILEEPGTATSASDVYSLGMTILEVITGSKPYAGLKTLTLWHSILTGKLPERPEKYIPTDDNQADRLWTLLKDCWKYEPHRRPVAREVQGRIWEIGRSSNQIAPFVPDELEGLVGDDRDMGLGAHIAATFDELEGRVGAGRGMGLDVRDPPDISTMFACGHLNHGPSGGGTLGSQGALRYSTASCQCPTFIAGRWPSFEGRGTLLNDCNH